MSIHSGVGLALGAVLGIACGSVTEVSPDGGADDAGDDALAIITAQLPDGNRGIPYEVQLEAAGGAPPYSWLTADLPPGLASGSDGHITGTPTEAGVFDVSLTVTDGAGTTAEASFSLSVANDLYVLTDSLPRLHVLERYRVELEVAGGDEPYDFGASGLPPGLIINADSGVITNDPTGTAITDASDSEVTFTVTDAAGAGATAALTLPVTGLDAVAAGGAHTCALDDEGAAFCWGVNSFSQLGDEGAGDFEPLPVEVAGGHTFTSIASGGADVLHTCAVDESGTARCWGGNNFGQLGNDDEGVDSAVPVEPAGDRAFPIISPGRQHTCALDGDGAAFCWGRNNFGQLGNDDEGVDSAVPVEVAGDRTFEAIASGGDHSCALDGEGTAFCWGRNFFGQLGNDDEGVDSAVPVRVQGSTATFASLSAGRDHNCALDDNGLAFCWGRNGLFQGGNAAGGDTLPTAQAVDGAREFSSIVAGNDFTCAVQETGAAWCWGANFNGQLGRGDDQEVTEFVSVIGDHAFAAVTVGLAHTCALDDSATAWCWGRNDRGQLGNGAAGDDEFVPRPVHPAAR